MAFTRRPFAFTSLPQVSTWRLASSQAVAVAEQAQARVAELDGRLAEVHAQLKVRPPSPDPHKP